MDFLRDAASLIEPYISQYGVGALFGIIYLESLGAPLPGESALIASSVMAATGDISIVQLLLAVWAAALLGDSTGYAIGRIGGRRLLQRYGCLSGTRSAFCQRLGYSDGRTYRRSKRYAR